MLNNIVERILNIRSEFKDMNEFKNIVKKVIPNAEVIDGYFKIYVVKENEMVRLSALRKNENDLLELSL